MMELCGEVSSWKVQLVSIYDGRLGRYHTNTLYSGLKTKGLGHATTNAETQGFFFHHFLAWNVRGTDAQEYVGTRAELDGLCKRGFQPKLCQDASNSANA
jgi:hypothetical protein